MATIKAFIRTKKKDKETFIRFRISDGRNVQLYHVSELKILPSLWDEKREQYKAKCVVRTDERIRLNTAVAERKKLLLTLYDSTPGITSSRLDSLVDECIHPEKHPEKRDDFFSLMELCLQKKKLSKLRAKDFRTLMYILKRYEMFVSAYKGKPFKLSVDEMGVDTLEDIESFFINEHNLYVEYPEIYKEIRTSIEPEYHFFKPQPRGHNTICSLFSRFRVFYNWCNKQDITANNPFKKYNRNTVEKYGTPFYLTLDERNLIADFDLSKYPQLEVQRDIFIFQCLIGCRVSDLLKMTDSNIINDVVEYIPHKTKEERPLVVRVPLNGRAKELVRKYRGIDIKGRLFPFVWAQSYNNSIREVLRLCGVARPVTIINSVTGEEEKRPIYEVASSHMARRTFIGNLYKKVKDPNLVGSLSGHSEGSKAFARYREIDDDIKRELVDMIE